LISKTKKAAGFSGGRGLCFLAIS